ncbi:hypothetical protein ACFJIY_21465 [Pimelobacter simplex]|uniref:hypothetical protein n=1 Tax=Nocardioides simplex TaxID=2045 RepID=UPI00366AA79E
MTRLPAGLAPWSEALAVLDPALAVVLGPMLHRIDDLVARLDDHGGADGDPDGYDGLTNRGDPGRLLVGEWLLADEVPLEFLRRAAENELTYLRPARRHRTHHGRVVAVCDGGPDQWGAGRLVQLAALVVLHRRARAAGSELEVVLLPEGRSAGGEISEWLPVWLRSRSPSSVGADELDAALASAGEGDDRIWLLGGSRTRALAPGHRRSISSAVTAWGDDGADTVTVRVANATAQLTLPQAPEAIAALRGSGLLRTSGTLRRSTVPGTGQGAVFGSADARLLWRGEEEGELLGCFVGYGESGKLRHYRLGGTIVAAASMRRRIVAAVCEQGSIRIRVLGKDLARVDEIDVALGRLGLDDAAIRELAGQPLPPLYLQHGRILLPAGGRWWELDGSTARPIDVSVLAPGAHLDSPRRVVVTGAGYYHDPDLAQSVRVASPPLLGPVVDGESWRCWTADTEMWAVYRGRALVAEISVPPDERVIGLCLVDEEPALVVLTESTRLLRTITSGHTRTWTRWAGPAHFDVHPSRPWVARTTRDRITVGDLATGQTLYDAGVAG